MGRAEQPADWQPRTPRPWLSLDGVPAVSDDEHKMLGRRETTPSQVPDIHIPPYLLDPEPTTTEGET